MPTFLVIFQSPGWRFSRVFLVIWCVSLGLGLHFSPSLNILCCPFFSFYIFLLSSQFFLALIKSSLVLIKVISLDFGCSLINLTFTFWWGLIVLLLLLKVFWIFILGLLQFFFYQRKKPESCVITKSFLFWIFAWSQIFWKKCSLSFFLFYFRVSLAVFWLI